MIQKTKNLKTQRPAKVEDLEFLFPKRTSQPVDIQKYTKRGILPKKFLILFRDD